MSHDRLIKLAAKHNFPQALVSVAVNAYKMARTVTYDGQAADDLFPVKGIIAGDSLSDCLVKLYYLDVFDEFTLNNPDAELEVYFDDIQIAARGPAEQVINVMSRAASTLRKSIETDLEAELALEGLRHLGQPVALRQAPPDPR